MRGFRLIAAIVLNVGILSGCSNQPPANRAAEQHSSVAQTKEPVLYTARECLRQVEGQAHLWAADAKPIHLESTLTSESSGRDGKAAVWQFMYISAHRNAMRSFACSGSREPSAPAFGVSTGLDMPLPRDGSPFESFLLKTDSDKAFEVAQGHGGEALFKKDSAQPVTYLLEMARGQTVPYWYVIYGKDLKNQKGIGIINATTGAFVRASR